MVQHFLNDFLCESEYLDKLLVIGWVAVVLGSLTSGVDGAEGVVEGIDCSVGGDLWIVSYVLALFGLVSQTLFLREETL